MLHNRDTQGHSGISTINPSEQKTHREAFLDSLRFNRLWRWRPAFASLLPAAVLLLSSSSLYAQNCNNNQAPIANLGPDRTGQINVSLTFSAAGSSDPDGTLNSYWFNFGDGAFTGCNPMQAFNTVTRRQGLTVCVCGYETIAMFFPQRTRRL